jgi:DNA polymerase elongation subunit (family B)
MKPVLIFDCEVYGDYFLLAFRNVASGNVVTCEAFAGQALDVAKIQRILAAYTLVSFNGAHFDLPVLAMALTGAPCEKIKAVCDAIIVGKKKSWEIYREYGLAQFEIDHIDLIEVAPGQIGLKHYGGRLHAPTLQDLPIAPAASIAPEQRELLRTYCANDLALTERLYQHLLPQIELRARMTQEYGIDLRSKSDAQIAEAVIRSEVEARTKTKLRRCELPANTKLQYTPPAWIDFATRPLREIFDLVREADYRIDQWGSPLMPTTMVDAQVAIGGSVYRLGIGGLHSSETRAAHVADEQNFLVDRDVASYYPSIILGCGLAPANMGEHFLVVYRSIVERRLMAKRTGDKLSADVLKIVVNGSFGKLGSKWSVLYAPALFLQVTLTGQLALLMLIERLEMHGIPVVSANTDGVVIKCPVKQSAEMDAIVDWWESITGFATEATDYAAIYSRDVNNYIALKVGGGVKTKGAYASTSLSKSPANEICTEAAIAYLTDGTPVATTITSCRDITKYLTLRQVNGGALWQGQPLGRVVRWYYARGETAAIHYQTNGNTVARSQGSRPCMVLPETFPADIDIDWYIGEASDLLTDLGVKGACAAGPQATLFKEAAA